MRYSLESSSWSRSLSKAIDTAATNIFNLVVPETPRDVPTSSGYLHKQARRVVITSWNFKMRTTTTGDVRVFLESYRITGAVLERVISEWACPNTVAGSNIVTDYWQDPLGLALPLLSAGDATSGVGLRVRIRNIADGANVNLNSAVIETLSLAVTGYWASAGVSRWDHS